jgi:hypothetical protein
VAEKAFNGKLTRYEQAKKAQAVNQVRVFTHKENPIMLCSDPYRPTWPGNEDYVTRRSDGLAAPACDYFEMCLLCEKVEITEETLPYLARWLSDIREWRRTQGGGNFPFFMHQRYQAINEVFELCETDEYWRRKLEDAEEIAASEDFDAPPIWRSI